MKKLIYIILFSSLFFACTKLDEKLYETLPLSDYPENALQLANLSVDCYSRLSPLADDGGWWFWAQEISGGDIVFPTRAGDWDDGGKWRVMHQHAWTNDVEGVNRMWSCFWDAIIICNQTLDLMRNMELTPALRSKIAEVEVLRSFYYYLLIDNYGDAPYITTAGFGVPAQPFKLRREVVFDSLTSTIERDLSYLKRSDIKYMTTRYTAFALLSKLYVNAEVYTGATQWGKANQYIDSVLAGPYSLGGINDPFLTVNNASSEIIFSIPYDEVAMPGFRIHMRTLHYTGNLVFDMPVGPWNGCAASEDFYNSFEVNDQRKADWFFVGQQYDTKGVAIKYKVVDLLYPVVFNPHIPALRMGATNTVEEIQFSGARIKKYQIAKGAKESLSNDFPLFRLADFMLLKAEVQIRLGNSGDEYVNPIRVRAGLAPWTGTTLDQLLAERGRELWAEGHRRQDLIRYGKFLQAWWEKLEDDSPDRVVFPIPKWATDANPNLLADPL